MKEKFYIEIKGIKLGIVTEDGEEYVQNVAAELEDKLNSIMSGQRRCTLIEAALFTAMSLQSKSDEDDKKIKNLETQVALYQTSMNRLKLDNEELRTRLAQR